MEEITPVLFIGHGSPMNIILDNDFTRTLSAWGKKLPQPRAIMVISAHWMTRGTFVSCVERPETIYDFHGFPDELYRIEYPCPGAPEDAKFTAGILSKKQVSCSAEWGLDHGAWSVLKHLYPEASIPVFQLSLDYAFRDPNPKPIQHHYDIATGLSELRKRGVLIIGSGNVVHNLSRIDWDTSAGPHDFPWAVEFDTKVKQNIIDGNHQALIDYTSLGKSAALAVPSLDHYLPMIYSIALQEKGEPLSFTYEGFQNGSMSMRCFQIG